MINQAQVNTTVIERFNRLAAQNHLAHAYLLVGPKNSGKTQTALSLAQLVNCEYTPTFPGSVQPVISTFPRSVGVPCGNCVPCKKITSGNHPDVLVLGRDTTESIKIEDIRFLLSRAHLMTYEARTKVFIILNIELMTLEAANALLKTLEEPAANTLMILTTSVPEDTLDTIKSRCHVVKFLTKEEAVPSNRKVLDEMLLNHQNDSFLKEISANPQDCTQSLRLLLSFFRDVILFKSGMPQTTLVHQDYLKEIQRFAARSFDDISVIIQRIIQTKKLVDEKLNAKMSLSLLREHIWAN